jgi:hypothetical protein
MTVVCFLERLGTMKTTTLRLINRTAFIIALLGLIPASALNKEQLESSGTNTLRIISTTILIISFCSIVITGAVIDHRQTKEREQ